MPHLNPSSVGIEVGPSPHKDTMTISEILLEDFDMEIGMTRRILAAVPVDIPDYKPHEKSMPLCKLAMHVATLPRLGITILTTPSLDLTTVAWPPLTLVSSEELLHDFDTLAAEARAALGAPAMPTCNTSGSFPMGRMSSAKTRGPVRFATSSSAT